MEDIIVTNETRPSNFIVFGLIFEDKQIFKETVKCVLGDEINDETYVVSEYVLSEKENRMGSSIYNKIRFDVYGESDKIYSLDMQNGYTNEAVHNRLVYYACRAVGGQEVRNFEYGKLKMCVVTFIFEKSSHGSNQFLTKHYMASEIDGKIVKYSDLLNVVELNLGYYEKTDNTDLNILCEFLKIQDNVQLDEFYKKHGGSKFGGMLYGKYMKIVIDTDRIERVANMQLYHEKYQLKYLTENDAKIIWDESREEVAINAIKEGLSLDLIKKLTGFNIDKIKELKRQYENDIK